MLNAAMEGVELNRSALFLLMRHATVGQDACPLHDKVVEALKESSAPWLSSRMRVCMSFTMLLLVVVVVLLLNRE
jgi:hypothetical protein